MVPFRLVSTRPAALFRRSFHHSLWLRSAHVLPPESEKYCRELVRKFDYENYLCCQFLPKSILPKVLAIRALNVEIAQIKDVVTNSTIGNIRLEWWKTSLDDIYQGKDISHPVAQGLKHVIESSSLHKAWLLKLVEGRKETLSDQTFASIQDMERYGESVVTPVFYATLHVMGYQNLQADHAVSHLGKAIGITNFLRGFLFHASKKQVFFPLDLLAKHQVSFEDLFQGSNQKRISDLVFDVASVANSHILKARTFHATIPAASTCALLPSIPTFQFLQRLQKADFNLFDPSLQKRNLWLPFILWKNKYSHTY